MGWRFMAALPLLAVLAWGICTGLIGHKEVETVRLEDDCENFLRKSLPKIFKTWSYPEWERRASSELKLSMNLKHLQKTFKEYKRTFGDLRRVGRAEGHVEVDNSGGVPETIGFYTSTLYFKMGHADVAMRLVKRAGGWKFQQFSVRSDMIEWEE